MSEKLRVAIVGSGWVSCNRHLPALAQHDDVEITGIVAKPESLASLSAKFLQKHRITKTGFTLDSDIVESADAVMIGTPPTTHVDLVMDALRRGKHVLVEKPMALSASDSDGMVQAAVDAGRILAVVHNLNFCRSVNKARRLLETGSLGQLKAVLGLQSSNHLRRLPVWYPDLPLGLFTDEAAHLIYLLQSFLPDASLQSLDVGPAVSDTDQTPDTVTMGFRSSDGRPGTLHMSFVGAASEWALILQGSERTAIVDLFRDILIVVRNDRRHLAHQVLRTSLSAVVGHVSGSITSGALMTSRRLDYGNREVVNRFVAAVRSGHDPMVISSTQGRDVVSVIEAAHAVRKSSR